MLECPIKIIAYKYSKGNQMKLITVIGLSLLLGLNAMAQNSRISCEQARIDAYQVWGQKINEAQQIWQQKISVNSSLAEKEAAYAERDQKLRVAYAERDQKIESACAGR